VTEVPIVDRARLERICMGKPELAQVYLDSLIGEATPIADGLAALLQADDRPALRESAHGLKGMAGNIGAARLQAAAFGLERSVADGADGAALSAGVSGIVAALNELRTERDAVT
jgi:HPt (histidine-containing phosphotransfer) domain-containing protein